MTVASVVAAAIAAGVAIGAGFAAEILAIAGDVMAFIHFTFAIGAGAFGSFRIHSGNT